jgi:L-lysine exporter family protein LysE/ArgO
MSLIPFLKGFATGAGLIIAIGAQNAFVLSQGIRRKYFLIIPLICFLCDALLISAGVVGLGGFFSTNPVLMRWASWGGAAFLTFYGLRSLLSVFKRGSLSGEEAGPLSLRAAVLATLAVTLLNPHVYLDTVVLLGSISSSFEGQGRYLFGAGAASASLCWFFLLSLAGRKLAPLFKNPLSWRIMDVAITIVMWLIAFSLIRGS